MSERPTMTDSESSNVFMPRSNAGQFRSLRELAREELFEARLHNEFPLYAPAEADALTRRNFMQVMGATLALGGLAAGCARQPEEMILPYVKAPEDIVPGKPLFFATANVQGGYAKPVLAESHMGRPTKVEGLPGHPASLGRTDAQTQASVLDLYDPDRTQSVTRAGMSALWDEFVKEAKQVLDNTRPEGGDGVRILTGSVTSPSLAGLMDEFLAAYPKAQWHQYEPAGRDNVRAGAKLAFGEYADTLYHFDQADVIVSLDSNFLDDGPANVRHSADYAHRRDVVDHHEDAAADHGAGAHGNIELNRLYAFESTPSPTGAAADHKYVVRPSQIEAVARRLAAALGVSAAVSDQDGLTEKLRGDLQKIAADLKQHSGAAIVIAGEQQPAIVHALAHAMNNALDAKGHTVTYIAPVEARPMDQMASLVQLAKDMHDDKVKLLIAFGVNPVYSAPADVDFAGGLKKVPLRATVGSYFDETADLCHWQIPSAHYLESWSDARAFDGTVSIVQPLIAPLYGGRSALDVISALFEKEPRSAHDIVQAHWKKQWGEVNFDSAWRTALAEGSVSNTANRPHPVQASGSFGSYAPAPLGADEFEVAILPDPGIGDGTHSNNAWLMELPRPMTKLTWDNAVFMGYSTALELGVEDEDLVEVSYNGASVRGPIFVQPGHASQTVTLHLGFGRSRSGKVSEGLGFNVYTVMNSASPSIGRGAKITKLAGKYPLARTEEHYNMENRNLVRHVTAQEYKDHPHGIQHGFDEKRPIHTPTDEETLYNLDEKKWDGNKWGMTIDLNQCTGCNACIVACQSENIIPVVGKFEVRKGREMLWLRLDRYYDTGAERDFKKNLSVEEQKEYLDNPQVYFQPVPCMQCENAPCEPVCPVGATQHSKEGLNDMVYNRCIGTRYCANNCPYKVRRFNFYHFSRTPLGMRGNREFVAVNFTHVHPESLKPMRNPDVTVRSRGVMEKCTYCVQRINAARIDSKKSGEAIPDGTVTTACQQACPSGAISFGNLNDPESVVSKKKASHRNYAILADLNTRARTTYLARITNPNPDLVEPKHTEPA